jgi:hypothetical protein
VRRGDWLSPLFFGLVVLAAPLTLFLNGLSAATLLTTVAFLGPLAAVLSLAGMAQRIVVTPRRIRVAYAFTLVDVPRPMLSGLSPRPTSTAT